MTTDRELLEMALEALENALDHLPKPNSTECASVAADIRSRLEQPDLARVGEVGVWGEQEPVACQERQAKRMKDGVVTEWSGWYLCRYRTIGEAKTEVCGHIPYEWRPLYTRPQREWQGLTDDEIDEIIGYVDPHCQEEQFARAIEAKLKEKNQ